MKKKILTQNAVLSILGDSIFVKNQHFNDANDTSLKSGMYGINFNVVNSLNLPADVTYGSMLVFNGNGLGDGGNPIVQLVISGFGKMYFRDKWSNSPFREWKVVVS